MLDKLLPTPPDHPSERNSVLRKNLKMHLGDGSFYVLGMSFIGIPTIFPMFIKELGGGPLAVGSVYVLWSIGSNIYAAFFAQRLKRKSFYKNPMVKFGFVHRFLFFVFGIFAAFVVPLITSTVSIPLFLLLLFLAALFGNMSGLPWFLVYSKTVPVKLRGRLLGLRQFIGSIAGAIGGYIVGLIIDAIAFPMNFSVIFFTGFFFTMISFYFLSQIEEQPTAQTEADVQFSPNIFGDAKRIIRSNKNFKNYLIVDTLMLMTMSTVSFYPIYAVEKFSIPPSYAGVFMAIVMVANIFSNVVFGIVADYYGHKINVMFAAAGFGLAAICAILSTSIFFYGFVFVFMGSAIQIHLISRMPFVAEISSERERPLYVGIMNTLTSPALLVGILFGVLVHYVGYEFIFIATTVLAASAVFVLSKHVEEPRFEKTVY